MSPLLAQFQWIPGIVILNEAFYWQTDLVGFPHASIEQSPEVVAAGCEDDFMCGDPLPLHYEGHI